MERDTQRRAQRAHDHTEPDIVEGESDSEGTEYSFEKRFEAFMMADVAFGPYYWETGDTVPWWRKGLHLTIWTSEKTLHGAEFVGEVVANLFGLNESKYQWVIDALLEAKERELRRSREHEQRQYLQGMFRCLLALLKSCTRSLDDHRAPICAEAKRCVEKDDARGYDEESVPAPPK